MSDEPAAPSSRLPGSAQKLWGAIRSSSVVRIALLGPTALAAIASVQDIGAIARTITEYWQPVIMWMNDQIAVLLPIDFPVDPQLITMVVFFLPFIAFGVPQVIAGRRLTIWLGILSLGAMFLLIVLQLAGIGVASPTVAGNATVIAVAWAICSAAYATAALFFRPIFSDHEMAGRFERALLPFTFFVFISVVIRLLAGEWSWRLILVSGFISLPLLAPRRLVEVGVIALSIVLISLLHLTATNWIRREQGSPPEPFWLGGQAEVRAGDTILLSGREIRLDGIDAPLPGATCGSLDAAAGARAKSDQIESDWGFP